MTNPIVTKTEDNQVKYLARNGKWVTDPSKAYAFNSASRELYLKQAAWLRNKSKAAPHYKLHHCFLKAVANAVRAAGAGIREKYTHKSKYFKKLGYSPAVLAFHLESLFKPGMTWKNYGSVWSIDHIVPACVATCEADVMKLWCLDNIRPCFNTENKHKGKYVPTQDEIARMR